MSHLSVITLPDHEVLTNSARSTPWAKWLRELPPSSTLKELRIPPGDFVLFPRGEMTRNLFSSIEALKISYDEDMDIVAYLFGSTHFPNLRSCTLTYMGGWGRMTLNHQLWLSSCLRPMVWCFCFTFNQPLNSTKSL